MGTWICFQEVAFLNWCLLWWYLRLQLYNSSCLDATCYSMFCCKNLPHLLISSWTQKDFAQGQTVKHALDQDLMKNSLYINICSKYCISAANILYVPVLTSIFSPWRWRRSIRSIFPVLSILIGQEARWHQFRDGVRGAGWNKKQTVWKG